MRSQSLRSLLLLLVLALVASACGGDEEDAAELEASPQAAAAATQDSSQICDADGLVAAVEGGAEEGTLAGMADDPVGTAASNNPVLTTLVTAVSEAGLVDTLNSADALTVFAPTDCAFAQLDASTLDAALADPTGLLTTVLGYHVIAGEQIASADLSGEYQTFTGETLSVEGSTVAGQADIVVPDVMTANATVHLIDTVMIPPSVAGAPAADEAAAVPSDSTTICDAKGVVAAVEGGASEGTLAGMADDPVATAASNNPVLTTLVTAVQAAGLVDTLNSAESLTVFAPTDCAFAAVAPATLEAALADPQGLLTSVLGLHVIPGQRLGSTDLQGEYTNFAGSTTAVDGTALSGPTIANRSSIIVPDVMTANATVHLIDAVLLPA